MTYISLENNLKKKLTCNSAWEESSLLERHCHVLLEHEGVDPRLVHGHACLSISHCYTLIRNHLGHWALLNTKENLLVRTWRPLFHPKNKNKCKPTLLSWIFPYHLSPTVWYCVPPCGFSNIFGFFFVGQFGFFTFGQCPKPKRNKKVK